MLHTLRLGHPTRGQAISLAEGHVRHLLGRVEPRYEPFRPSSEAPKQLFEAKIQVQKGVQDLPGSLDLPSLRQIDGLQAKSQTSSRQLMYTYANVEANKAPIDKGTPIEKQLYFMVFLASTCVFSEGKPRITAKFRCPGAATALS